MTCEFFTIDELSYVIRYPKGYVKGEKYPVIFFLHGAGFRGKDIKEIVNENPFFTVTAEYDDFPFISVAPACHKDLTWFDFMPTLKKLVNNISKSDFADKECLYLVGLSMGGYGTWQLAMSIPEYFAAIVPICGGGMYWNAARLVNVPVRAFHGAKDNAVFIEESEKMVAAVNKHGGNAKLTVYSEHGHNVWTDTFKNPEVFEWLLSNTNKNISAVIDSYTDGKLYG